jgi:hypothetical protein
MKAKKIDADFDSGKILLLHLIYRKLVGPIKNSGG